MYIPGKRKQLRASSGIQEEMLSTHDPSPSGANWEAHRAHLCLCPSAPTHSPRLVGVADEAGWVGCTWVVWERAGFLQLRLQLHLPVWLGGRTGLGNFDFSPCPQRYSISSSNPTSIQYPSENLWNLTSIDCISSYDSGARGLLDEAATRAPVIHRTGVQMRDGVTSQSSGLAWGTGPPPCLSYQGDAGPGKGTVIFRNLDSAPRWLCHPG